MQCGRCSSVFSELPSFGEETICGPCEVKANQDDPSTRFVDGTPGTPLDFVSNSCSHCGKEAKAQEKMVVSVPAINRPDYQPGEPNDLICLICLVKEEAASVQPRVRLLWPAPAKKVKKGKSKIEFSRTSDVDLLINGSVKVTIQQSCIDHAVICDFCICVFYILYFSGS